MFGHEAVVFAVCCCDLTRTVRCFNGGNGAVVENIVQCDCAGSGDKEVWRRVVKGQACFCCGVDECSIIDIGGSDNRCHFGRVRLEIHVIVCLF